ncbi:hypothetical protein METBIDRAFT_49947 [Metschnikowia bicuspidata var. bicuspidata NRRL YB-4993]|uniref:Uncharacterized protein n=1 Tax=Metschnikowia bicuspidata var. bicuspidata NRRL YB-4993 TaxID=869754 RepID=A0A1A0HH31_9ASCO|nr:hypothetical protein METBIDRAFT_49947 [Metschnikowia bicuspidata var. bicuspidata NRRL YB-4993]OBA23306.1 hypothetical protein METBIDRAFT_49947 [Metschnikowia bicuspidata var. bicuspidata NRRL YB-4993]
MFKSLRHKALALSAGSLRSPAENMKPDPAVHAAVLLQVHAFEIALQAMDLLLDDRNTEGVELLKAEHAKYKRENADPAAVFPLALGVMEFIEATLGFETDVMDRARKSLGEAENASLAHAKYSQKAGIATSHIYPPGTEFQVTYAELSLLNALVMLLQENNTMMDQAKALLKLRKAYQILDATYKKINDLEPLFSKNLAKFRKQSLNHSFSSVDLPGFTIPDPAARPELAPATKSLSADKQLMRDLERVYQMRKARIEGTSINSSVGSNNLLSPKTCSLLASVMSLDTLLSSLSTETNAASDLHLHVSTIDEFIHSGVQLCFGILQVVLSLIPPTIGKVLSIVGFKGDRTTGLHMLWRTAITARNIHGDLALLFLLVFYDGPIQFVDTGFQLPGHADEDVTDIIQLKDRSTVSDTELLKIVDHPKLYTPQLLKKARELFPNNCLWLLQEGRMLVSLGEIEQALHMMQRFTDDPNSRVEMEQVEAIFTFDRAIFYTFVHDFDSAARDFTRMLEISSWSLAVYLFVAGACYLEKWRKIQAGLLEFDTVEEKNEKLAFYEQKADYYLKLAPTYVPGHGENASKKGGIGGLGKQMPFDKFVLRKTKQILSRMKAYPRLLYIECVGTSLILELIYFWNGYSRMDAEKLKQLIRMLDFSIGPHAKFPETTDEAMIRQLFQSIALRQSGKVNEGLNLLDTQVISKYVTQDSANLPFKFRKLTYSPYLYPTALHERASFAWKLQFQSDTRRAVTESSAWLKKAETVSDVGDYELSNRTSMAIKAASERLEQMREILDKEE